MMDVLVDPAFADNRLVYLSYTIAGDGGYSTRVSRARLEGDTLVDHQVLFTAQPFFNERRHFGSRLLIADGYLYITVGDRGNRDLAQSLESHNGKVIRLTVDGEVPPDNPFVGQPGALAEIYTYGHRNPQGLARHPHSGAIWSAEHGPLGGDEINELRAGANYGWPDHHLRQGVLGRLHRRGYLQGGHGAAAGLLRPVDRCGGHGLLQRGCLWLAGLRAGLWIAGYPHLAAGPATRWCG